jgi:hypothetical protein
MCGVGTRERDSPTESDRTMAAEKSLLRSWTKVLCVNAWFVNYRNPSFANLPGRLQTQSTTALRAACKIARTPSADVDSSALQVASISVVGNGAAWPAIRHPSMNPPSKVLFSSFISRCSSTSLDFCVIAALWSRGIHLPVRPSVHPY